MFMKHPKTTKPRRPGKLPNWFRRILGSANLLIIGQTNGILQTHPVSIVWDVVQKLWHIKFAYNLTMSVTTPLQNFILRWSALFPTRHHFEKKKKKNMSWFFTSRPVGLPSNISDVSTTLPASHFHFLNPPYVSMVAPLLAAVAVAE